MTRLPVMAAVRSSLTALAMAASLASGWAVAQSAPSAEAVPVLSAAERASLAGRVELHGLPSLTLSDAQFLRGETQGAQPVTVGAELRLAAVPGRQPVVVLIHGSGGIGSNVDLWARDFNAMGVATLAIDGFTGRGLVSTSTQQAALGRLNLSLDAYKALDLLAKHPRIDPQRVVLMGFSRGGQATLFASLKRFNEQWNRSGIRYAAYIPFYPDCMTQYQGDTELAGGPVRIHHGLADDYNPAAACQPYVARLQKAGQDVELLPYPGAHHGFDAPTAPNPAQPSKGAQTVRACVIRETTPGLLVNEATGQAFSYEDACVQRDPHVGHDPVATAQARASVHGFVRQLFKLPASAKP
ncbi:dienelactone hydrolase family protein [Curvibacter sp. HBC28]|uniref:Dienelactone hydrolase family protein n=1 Tax=Curvibacter microcysteis TaxID=3026419 RepID=A0ABT5MCA9_9BURK|nr:dienelactone hydrolase family protein [Curvibacter sp. HBC28]MDD0814218.1 dienelactone hydrolase family protein [Curvibacter sp. HBC28]